MVTVPETTPTPRRRAVAGDGARRSNTRYRQRSVKVRLSSAELDRIIELVALYNGRLDTPRLRSKWITPASFCRAAAMGTAIHARSITMPLREIRRDVARLGNVIKTMIEYGQGDHEGKAPVGKFLRIARGLTPAELATAQAIERVMLVLIFACAKPPPFRLTTLANIDDEPSRSEAIMVSLTDDEFATVRDRANKRNMPMAVFVRREALATPAPVQLAATIARTHADINRAGSELIGLLTSGASLTDVLSDLLGKLRGLQAALC
jgi:hypothetical protein